MENKFKSSLIADRAYAFALELIKILRELDKTSENLILFKQVIRSVTSIGANIEEALGGNSKKEFIHSMNIAKKEARETLYWLRLISDLNLRFKDRLDAIRSENREIINILTKIVKTSTGKLL